jgi:hypothetical protein
MNIWEPKEISVDQCFAAQIGPLRLWLKRAGDELRMAFHGSPEPESLTEIRPLAPHAGAEPEDLEWGRWVVGPMGESVRLVPVMPDRPVVVHPEMPVKIPSDQEALFFVSIPVWVRVTAGQAGKLKLCEQPSVVLSNTWFGDTVSGELCYSLRSRARRSITDSEPRPHFAVCPVRIRNTSTSQLAVERLCVHVEHLRIYFGPRQLWTNDVNITFSGEADVSRVSYLQNPPDHEPVERVLSEARTPLKKSLLQRSLGGMTLPGAAQNGSK